MIEELTAEASEAFLRRQRVGRVGCHLDGVTYVVPIIYAWDDGAAYVYTTEGQKVSMLRSNPTTCLEVDEYLPGGSWTSVIVQGRYEELVGQDAERTLTLLAAAMPTANRKGQDGGGRRGEGRVPVAFRVVAESVTGRTVDRTAS